jgi:hypothetical protein
MDTEEILAGARAMLREQAEQRPFRNIASHEAGYVLASLVTFGTGHIQRVWRYPRSGASGAVEWSNKPRMTVREHSILLAAGTAGQWAVGSLENLGVKDREQFEGEAIWLPARECISWWEALNRAEMMIAQNRSFFDLLVRLISENFVVDGAVIDRLWLDYKQRSQAANRSDSGLRYRITEPQQVTL